MNISVLSHYFHKILFDRRHPFFQLFRYLFSLDEPTFDSTEFFRDAEVLASDSGSETSDPRPEQYIFDSD